MGALCSKSIRDWRHGCRGDTQAVVKMEGGKQSNGCPNVCTSLRSPGTIQQSTASTSCLKLPSIHLHARSTQDVFFSRFTRALNIIFRSICLRAGRVKLMASPSCGVDAWGAPLTVCGKGEVMTEKMSVSQQQKDKDSPARAIFKIF